MNSRLLVAVSLLALVSAGCSDEPANSEASAPAVETTPAGSEVASVPGAADSDPAATTSPEGAPLSEEQVREAFASARTTAREQRAEYRAMRNQLVAKRSEIAAAKAANDTARVKILGGELSALKKIAEAQRAKYEGAQAQSETTEPAAN